MTTETAKHRELGLTDSEFALIVEKMGREPNVVELAMFSLLWSEHCAYKHSRKLLKQLPTEGERVVMGPGENAGAPAAATASKTRSPSVEPVSGSTACSGCGISPTTLPASFRTPAMSRADPFGFCPGA